MEVDCGAFVAIVSGHKYFADFHRSVDVEHHDGKQENDDDDIDQVEK